MKKSRKNIMVAIGIILQMILVTGIIFKASGLEPVLAIRFEGKNFDDAIRGITDEVGTSLAITQLLITKDTKVNTITDKINEIHPKLVILMDNKSIGLFKEYQATVPDSVIKIPSVSLMAVLIPKAINGIKNGAGISYEIPIVTSIVSLQTVLQTPLKKVGVIHRELMSDLIKENIGYCAREKIAIAPYLISKDMDVKDAIQKGLDKLVNNEHINALWIPNDNALLKGDFIRDIWIPFVNKNKIPVIVGIEILVTPQINLGTFAVLPDHIALGTQAGGMILEIMDNGWKVGERHTEPPLSIYKIINLQQAKSKFNVKDEQLQNVDRLAQ